jgi:hypothetical protein
MDRQGRKTTVAARAMAERKVLAHLSERVAMRRHSFVWPGMVPMRLRRQWRRRSWPAALPRGFRPGMPGRISLSVTAALNQSALTGSTARVGDQPFRGWQAARQGGRAGVVADLARRHEEPQRAALRIRHGVQLGVQPALRSPDEATALVVGPPFLARRLEAVRCAFR